MTTICPCGIDHHAAAEAPAVAIAEAEAHADAAESLADAEVVAEAARSERNADDNDTLEAVAELEADAAVAIAEAQADAAVAIAEADAAADVAIAEAAADVAISDAGDELPAELDDDDGGQVDELEAAGEPIGVEVPPQVETEADRPHAPARAGVRTVSRFASHRAHR